VLRDPRGERLMRRKVRRWVAMGTGGWNFQQMGMSEYSQELLDRWPRPLFISPSGKSVKTGHRLLPKTPAANPVREAYRLWNNGAAITQGRSSWDQIAVLFVARPELFTVESSGRIERLPDGKVAWNSQEDKALHHRVTPCIPNEQMAEMIEELMARPPRLRRERQR
jgi:hypothetical protein